MVADPYADEDEVFHEYGVKLSTIDDLSSVDALVVAVGHMVYRNMGLSQIKKMLKSEKPVLADLKALYDRHEATALGLTVFRF